MKCSNESPYPTSPAINNRVVKPKNIEKLLLIRSIDVKMTPKRSSKICSVSVCVCIDQRTAFVLLSLIIEVWRLISFHGHGQMQLVVQFDFRWISSEKLHCSNSELLPLSLPGRLQRYSRQFRKEFFVWASSTSWRSLRFFSGILSGDHQSSRQSIEDNLCQSVRMWPVKIDWVSQAINEEILPFDLLFKRE